MVFYGMKTMREIKVSLLSKKEMCNLFQQKVSDEVLASSSLQVVVKDVAKECGGLH